MMLCKRLKTRCRWVTKYTISLTSCGILKGLWNKGILLIQKAVRVYSSAFFVIFAPLYPFNYEKKKKKQTNSKKQLSFLIVLILCGIITAYQTTNSKEKTTAPEQTEGTVQSAPKIPIYTSSKPLPQAPPKYCCNAPDTSYPITPISALPTG